MGRPAPVRVAVRHSRRPPRPRSRHPRIRGLGRREADVPETLTADLVHRFRAMASDITVRIIDPSEEAPGAITRVEGIFSSVERSCSRFDPTSDLMRANAQPGEWTNVDAACLGAIETAYLAYELTAGAFDPRVLSSLTALGYDRSLNFGAGDVVTQATDAIGPLHAPWALSIDAPRGRVRLGADPIDLGGIGKGYAVRLAIAELAGMGRAALVEAGGDLATFGDGPDRAPGETRGWRAAVEDPRGGSEPMAVLDVTDASAATSSIRLRRWTSGDREVHHIIDPRTGRSADSGLLAVTVIGEDTAWAEVWTKALFLSGIDDIRVHAEDAGLAAYWMDAQGGRGATESMQARVLWEGAA